jgi:beta-1,4-N-acetylglucosaminyltransferase
MLAPLVALVVVALLLRLVFILRCTPSRNRSKARRVMVVLGSGGHTSEMFQAIEQIPKEEWACKTVLYVYSSTDKDSKGVAEGFEMTFLGRTARTAVIPRAREVGQSYFTSIFTTLRAAASALVLVLDEQPDAIVTNGPGVCIPIVVANILVALFLGRQRATTTYFESFTCVDHVSLSGKIMLVLGDVVTVQWPGLAEQLRRKGFKRVAYGGRFAHDKGSGVRGSAPLLRSNFLGDGKEKRTCVVTVGSTQFDEMIQAVDTSEFYSAIADLGINHVLIQKGRSKVDITCECPAAQLQREVVDYRPGLPAVIRSASLVISHAGAGTILEALEAGVPTIVVPNARLMSNHQLQLAQALAHRKHLFYALPDASLVELLHSGEWTTLRRVPPRDGTAMRKFVLPLLE